MAERMAQVAAAAMFVRAAADPGTPDLTAAQRDLAAERSRDALAEAAAALGELLPVLLIRAEAGEPVDRMLVEVDATPSPAAGPRADAEVAALRPLVPVAIIAMRLGAGPAAPEGEEHVWRRLDERLADLEATNRPLHHDLTRQVQACLAIVRADLPPDPRAA